MKHCQPTEDGVKMGARLRSGWHNVRRGNTTRGIPRAFVDPTLARRLAAFAVVLLCAVPASAQEADSGLLWGEEVTDSFVGSYIPREWNVRDVLTVIISEQDSASSEADLVTDRRSRLEGALKEWFRFRTQEPDGDDAFEDWKILPALEHDGQRIQPSADFDFRIRRDNTAETTRASSIQFRLAAEVVQVLPNGNLVLEAKKKREINDEMEELSITGVCRPEDVNDDNEITSERIADVHVRFSGSGSVSDTAERGFISRILDMLFPF